MMIDLSSLHQSWSAQYRISTCQTRSVGEELSLMIRRADSLSIYNILESILFVQNLAVLGLHADSV